MCSADSQANAARCFNLAPTLMAHAGKDAPFIYPTADSRYAVEERGGVRDFWDRKSFPPRSAHATTSFYIRRIR